MPVSRLLLVRHGESEWNAAGRWQGDEDPPLSQLGREQATRAAQLVGTVDFVAASDLQRAAATAWIIAEDIGVGPVLVEPRLRETAFGAWQGLTRAEIESGWPGWIAEHRRPDDAEPIEHALARFTDGIRALAAMHPGADGLVVAHGGIMRLLARALGAGPMSMSNLSGYRLDVDGEGTMSVGEPVRLIDDAEAPRTW